MTGVFPQTGLPLLSPLASYFLTFSLIQAAFGLADVSLWVGLADYASAFDSVSAPYLAFGLGLSANLVAMTTGGMISRVILPRFPVDHVAGTTMVVTLALFGAGYALALSQGDLHLNRRPRPDENPSSTTSSQGTGAVARADRVAGSPKREPLKLPDTLARKLTPREREVAELLIKGLSNSEIERALHIASGTLKTHVTHVYAKIGIDGQQKLILLALGERPDEWD